MSADLFASAAAADPIRPWEYIRLIREAAGLTIAQTARPYWIKAEGRPDLAKIRADVERLTGDVERPGFVIRMDYLVDDLRRALPHFDADVYRQLRDEPADRHPSICRGCGCSSWSPSLTDDGCESTIENGRCTACEESAARQHPSRQRAA